MNAREASNQAAHLRRRGIALKPMPYELRRAPASKLSQDDVTELRVLAAGIADGRRRAEECEQGRVEAERYRGA